MNLLFISFLTFLSFYDNDSSSIVEGYFLPKKFLIFLGTKWCGPGNIAKNDSDLGIFKYTDACCRNHDLCPDFIEGYQTKFNLMNPSFYTRLNCNCEEEFHKCLKSVNTIISIKIGLIYFTTIGTQCYKDEHPIVGCNRYTFFPRIKCLKHKFDETKEKMYQWFDVNNF